MERVFPSLQLVFGLTFIYFFQSSPISEFELLFQDSLWDLQLFFTIKVKVLFCIRSFTKCFLITVGVFSTCLKSFSEDKTAMNLKKK